MPVLNVERYLSPALDNGEPHLIARQDGPPFRPGGRPSGWTGPPPWVVRPTGSFYSQSASPSVSPPASSSASPDASQSTGVPPPPMPSESSSPLVGGGTTTNEAVASRSSGAPVGAIVGGVLGGLALLCAFILAWRFLKARERRAAIAQEKPPTISPFRTDIERQPATGDASGGISPQDYSSIQTLSTLIAATGSAGSQKGYPKSAAPSIQRTASSARSYAASDVSTSVVPSPTSTEDPQVIQAIRTLQTFLQPRMDRIPEHRSGEVVAGFPESPSPPPPAYEANSSSDSRRSTEKIRMET
ncbi:hypothetical protein BKA70DRAFT_1266874 [Coprinopsis sp. MPI-PUGE-AT-0042]|nr:hypothetical protein BKA70DRAFT_1266874 [Coprinopsis sp. MPI-PUGE-AT-0042]